VIDELVVSIGQGLFALEATLRTGRARSHTLGVLQFDERRGKAGDVVLAEARHVCGWVVGVVVVYCGKGNNLHISNKY
jgi:hypothetical protein